MNISRVRGVGSQVTIRSAHRADNPGIRVLLSQMPGWETAQLSASHDENIVAVDERGQIVGWIMGNHVSEAWRNVLGYAQTDGWRCSYIARLLVDERYRSNGIGALLLESFSRESSTAGRDTIIASPQSGENELALLRFYARAGYRRAESGQVHKGPWGPADHVPLLELPASFLGSAPDPLAEETIAEYKQRLGDYK